MTKKNNSQIITNLNKKKKIITSYLDSKKYCTTKSICWFLLSGITGITSGLLIKNLMDHFVIIDFRIEAIALVILGLLSYTSLIICAINLHERRLRNSIEQNTQELDKILISEYNYSSIAGEKIKAQSGNYLLEYDYHIEIPTRHQNDNTCLSRSKEWFLKLVAPRDSIVCSEIVNNMGQEIA